LHTACEHAPDRDRDAQFSSEQLQAVVDEHLKDKTNILGTIVQVDVQGTESYRAASGFTDSSLTAPIEADTKFIIGSVTKIFTAVLVHQAIEKGQVQLGGPIIDYLPPDWSAILQEIEHGDEITVEHALSHRSGIPDVTNSEAFMESVFLGSEVALKPLDIVRMVQQTGELEFTPGESYDYSSVNYILLGGLIEQVSDLSYRQSLRNNILERIGLENTSLVDKTYGSFNGAIARGYTAVGDVSDDGHEINVEWAHAAGGIISTAGDLVLFYRALASGELFNETGTYQQMCQLVGHNESYGRGLEVIDDPDIGLYYGHRGSFLGSQAILAHFPDERMTIAIAHTYDGFSMSEPADLIKVIVQNIRGEAPAEHADLELEGPEILAASSNLVINQDEPARGEWDFAANEEWRLDSMGHLPLRMVGDIYVDDDESLYLLDRGTAKIAVLDADGNLLRLFGGRGDGSRFEHPLDMFVTPGFVHVLDMGRSGNRIKTYDKRGNYVETSDIEGGVSPRVFIDDESFVAVRSAPGILQRPTHELLEILSLTGEDRSVLMKFPAEDKLIMEVMVPRGRYILGEDDINIFPRLIVHFDGERIYLGRSDAYVVKNIDRRGAEHLAFSLAGRNRELLPQDYAVNLAGRTEVAGREMTGETKQQFLTRFPERQAFFTKITADEQGLIYVFVPDIADLGKQEIDIFSPEGRYLYHATLELPGGLERIGPLELRGEHLYALVNSEQDATWLIKYRIQRPVR
jgi:D-alanyl-D-alanine carboxypeptidase